jgi:hypothetical protein
MSAMLILLLGVLPPLAAGPLAGLAFIEILKRGKPWYQIPFWALLILLNLLIMLWIGGSSGTWLPIASLSAFFATPVTSILTVFAMRKAWTRLETLKGADGRRKRWLPVGMILIPLLQSGMFVLLLIFGPRLCKIGFFLC